MNDTSTENVPPQRDPDQTSLNINRAVAGDEQSQAWLIERFTPMLLIAARARLREHMRRFCEPEDLVQEVWAVALPRLGDLRARDGRVTPVLVKFLSHTLLNLYYNLMQKCVRWQKLQPASWGFSVRTDSVIEPSAHTRGAVTRAMHAEAVQDLEHCLDQLNDKDRRVVILRGIEQLPNKVVALLVGELPDTVGARYRRALTKVRSMLRDSVFDELD